MTLTQLKTATLNKEAENFERLIKMNFPCLNFTTKKEGENHTVFTIEVEEHEYCSVLTFIELNN